MTHKPPVMHTSGSGIVTCRVSVAGGLSAEITTRDISDLLALLHSLGFAQTKVTSTPSASNAISTCTGTSLSIDAALLQESVLKESRRLNEITA